MKKVAIIQSNYIPWKGYFDLIANVDDFVLYDDVQYTRRDWRNRNKIKTKEGLKWLTIPVEVKGKYHQKINETLVANDDWKLNHWLQLEENYSQAPYFNTVSNWLKEEYLNLKLKDLSSINRHFITLICDNLGIKTKILNSHDFNLKKDKNERLVHICEQLQAHCYVTGPSARNYLDEECFHKRGILVEWADYSNYPRYSQLHQEFEHSVSILDLLFNVGIESSGKYMKHV